MLNTDALLTAASQQTGLTDFGDPAMHEGLGVLVNALNTEAKLTEAGIGRWAGSITATLANRLQVEDYLKANPQLVAAPIEKPLFVFGLPRTGTTLAINLLVSDPARRRFMRWEAFATVPPAGPGELRSDPRYHAEQARLDASLKYLPHINAMHHEDADSSCECQFAMSPAFCSQVYDSQVNIPSYREWFFAADYRPAFRYHKRLMQLLQQHNKGRWTFKNPWHPLYLDALKDIYPDATLVMTHRDPAETVGSALSLTHAVRQMFSDDVSIPDMVKGKFDTFDLMIARVAAYEAKHGAGSVHHLHYTALMADPIGEIRKVYAHTGDAFSPQAEAAMRATLADNPKGKFGKHEYSLADYGLTAEGVRTHYQTYIDRYAIACRA